MGIYFTSFWIFLDICYIYFFAFHEMTFLKKVGKTDFKLCLVNVELRIENEE